MAWSVSFANAPSIIVVAESISSAAEMAARTRPTGEVVGIIRLGRVVGGAA